MLKRLFSIISISLIIIGVFFNSYFIECPVYADTTTDNWTNVTTNAELVEAFRYYCKSRDVTIDGSIADGVTKFTTATFNGLCNSLGIDITSLQAHLKRDTDGNAGVRFLFDSTGINAYNRIFAQFLQDNDLEVGDSVPVSDPKVLYSGVLFEDYDHNKCLAYVCTSNGGSVETVNSFGTVPSYVTYKGSPYIHTGETAAALYNNGTDTITVKTNENTTVPVNVHVDNGNAGSTGEYDNFTNLKYSTTYGLNVYGSIISYNNTAHENITRVREYNGELCVLQFNGNFYLGFFNNYADKDHLGESVSYTTRLLSTRVRMYPYEATNSNVYITTNNTVINNNNYMGDTIINNEGDTINNNYPDPNPNPTPDPPTIPDSGGWQDFTLPEMPNDWLIYGMEKKFPFDIPFNILFGLSLLNHEPEIPKFEGDIDLKVCIWHYDIDLTPFDDIAKILRKFEVLAFIIGLAMITKELIMWG